MTQTLRDYAAAKLDALDERTAAAQCNEVLAKVLLHNLACLVHAIEKYGIGVSFPLGVGKS